MVFYLVGLVILSGTAEHEVLGSIPRSAKVLLRFSINVSSEGDTYYFVLG